MLKKDVEINWIDQERNSFEDIKKSIVGAPTLISPENTKGFCIFSFASYDTVAAILLQKNDEGLDHPISFFSRTLRDVELKYDPIEKQAYALIKYLKTFRIHILHGKVIAYVPSATAKDDLTQPDIDGKRAKWITKLIEFDIEVKPTKLVKGLGLAKLMAKENYELLGMNLTYVRSAKVQTMVAAETEVNQDQNNSLAVAVNISSCEWYSGIIQFFLKLEVSLNLTPNQA